MCQECFKLHAKETGHGVSVILCKQSIEFFVEWSNILVAKIVGWLDDIVTGGYTKVVEMKLLPNYPKGTISQLA
jgi:hypothetical protein